MNFTNGNIPSVYSEGITVEKKELKKNKKIWWHVIYTNGIINGKLVGKLFTSP
jgi:hypothetical protein